MILSENVVVLIFKLKDYLQQTKNFSLNEFISEIREIIQQLTVNRFRFTTIKSKTFKKTRVDSHVLSTFSFNWFVDKTSLRRAINKFNNVYRIYREKLFFSFKNRSFSSNTNSFLKKSSVFRFQRHRSQFFVSFRRRLIFSSITFAFESRNSSQAFSTFDSFTSRVNTFRDKSVSIFNIESTSESQKSFS